MNRPSISFRALLLILPVLLLPASSFAYGDSGDNKRIYYEQYMKRLNGPFFEPKLPARFKNREQHNYTRAPRPIVQPGQTMEDVTGQNPFVDSKKLNSVEAQVKRIEDENKALENAQQHNQVTQEYDTTVQQNIQNRQNERKRMERDLFSSIYVGDVSGVRKALAAGVDPNMDYKGYTPLHYAAALRKLDVIMLLLKNPKVDIGNKENQYFSLLYWGAYENHMEMIQKMLDRGADPNIRDDRGYTPAKYAESRGNQEMMSLLLERTLQRK